MPPQPQTERRPRMPRAPSAGARHMTTPMRRQRPSSANRNRARDSSSASPTPNGRSRNSSGSSNAGGPVIGASVKKRRSFQTPAGGRPGHPRTPSGGSSGALGLGIGMGDGGGGGGGFVNFTPSDHTLLMTGVAPSGSSKTKARREKEALEKRRRMSEAALKAVAAAGGDIDKLVEEGFVF
ncbi:Developmental regulatory protein wetA like [Verticillium longisporum]|nr:Developmental regulatory protein wetA like [Verticillium longisporum]